VRNGERACETRTRHATRPLREPAWKLPTASWPPQAALVESDLEAVRAYARRAHRDGAHGCAGKVNDAFSGCRPAAPMKMRVASSSPLVRNLNRISFVSGLALNSKPSTSPLVTI
jgi:hypothetical protein